jgi:hypothetical protein
MPSRRDRKHQQRLKKERRRGEAEERRQRRRYERELLEMADALADELVGLAAEPTRFVARLSELAGDPFFSLVLGRPSRAYSQGLNLAERVGPKVALALAGELEASAKETPHAAWWAVGLRKGAGDAAGAASLAAASDSTGATGAPGTMSWLVGELLLDADRPAEAAELAFRCCQGDPYDPVGNELLAEALQALHAHHRGEPAADVLLARFADRSRLYRLHDAFWDFLDRHSGLASWAAEEMAEWQATLLEAAGVDEWDKLSGQDRLVADTGHATPISDGYAGVASVLALEPTWVIGPGAAEEAPADGENRPKCYSLLSHFASDPATPPDLAELALELEKGARWGLWQIAEPAASPGVWATELITHQELYLAMAPGQLEELPRWAVLAGCVLPDRGVWRSGLAFALLDPSEGDLAAELAKALAANFMGEIAGEAGIKGAKKLRAVRPRLKDLPEHGVIARFAEPMAQPVADMHSKLLARALPVLIGKTWESLRRPPKMRNTDQEPVELLKATARVPDGGAFLEALSRHPDFEVEPATGGTSKIVWHGRPLTPMEAEMSWAELRRLVEEEGFGPVERAPEGEQRWVRGFLRLEGDLLIIDVNSRRRLERLTALLAKCGVPEPVVEARIDPSQDLALPWGWRPVEQAGSPEAEEIWRLHWLDEPLPLLGTSPRKAARDPKLAARLETALRRMEFDADLARFSGKRPIDVAAIRAQLGDEDGLPYAL